MPEVPVENNVIERFGSAGIAAENISFVRDSFIFNFAGSPAQFVDEFRKYYDPTMNAFDAAGKNGKAGQLQSELEELFTRQNTTRLGHRFRRPSCALRFQFL